jgi:acyl-CoA synthetase (NDP forming)
MAYVSPHAPEVGALLTRNGVPAFAAAESCTAALAAMLKVSSFVVPVEESDAGTTIDVGELPSGSLDEAQAKQLFARFNVPCAAERIVTTPAEAADAARELGGRVVLKILSSQITHKSDVGGVAIGLTPDTVGARLTTMTADVHAKAGMRPDRFLVQEMVGAGTELILGTHRDVLGTAVLLGMGGITAELFKDTTMRLLPQDARGIQGLSRADALAMAQELKTWPLLDGFRGRPKADVNALVDTIVAFSRMAAQLGDRLIEAEINPVFVRVHGEGVSAADGVVVLA